MARLCVGEGVATVYFVPVPGWDEADLDARCEEWVADEDSNHLDNSGSGIYHLSGSDVHCSWCGSAAGAVDSEERGCTDRIASRSGADEVL